VYLQSLVTTNVLLGLLTIPFRAPRKRTKATFLQQFRPCQCSSPVCETSL